MECAGFEVGRRQKKWPYHFRILGTIELMIELWMYNDFVKHWKRRYWKETSYGLRKSRRCFSVESRANARASSGRLRWPCLQNQSIKHAKFTPSRLLIQPPPPGTISATQIIVNTMAEIKIDKNLFQERLSHFVAAWKADKRSGDALFNGATSILVLMGKTEEAAQFQKNNAIHVRGNQAGGVRELHTDTFPSFGYWAMSSQQRSFSSP